MAEKLRRGGQGVRRQAQAQANARRVNRARAQGRSLAGRALAALPVSEHGWRQAFTALILAGALALAWFLAGISGARDYAAAQFAASTANAGFAVRHVEVRGVQRINEQQIFEEVLGQRDLAMSEVDIAALRARLLRLSWVADARVSRQLPDVLVIDIVERTAHAVLERDGRLELIDASGARLQAANAAEAEALLLLRGAGAAGRIGALEYLLDAAPALRRHVAAAEWVGQRRWNLTFSTGQRLALPEGEERAAAALVSFARADGVHRLIGGEVAAFDLRNAPRMYMRVPGRAERAAAALAEGEQS